MTARRNKEMLEVLRTTLLKANGSGLSDAELLGLFLTRRDATAFASLVRRHGSMV
jgi:DNA repair protein RadC